MCGNLSPDDHIFYLSDPSEARPRVKAPFAEWGIFLIGGASLVDGLQSTGLPRLILMKVLQLIVLFQSFHNTIAMANGLFLKSYFTKYYHFFFLLIGCIPLIVDDAPSDERYYIILYTGKIDHKVEYNPNARGETS